MGAIDFSTGNRAPYGGLTLHNLNETNWYETILRNTATVTEQYSMTKVSQFYGFGAENHSASNNLMVPKKTIDFDKSFPINLNRNTPESAGADELVFNYRSIASNVKFSE